MLSISPSAVEHHVELFDALAILGLAHEQAKRLLAALAFASAIFLQKAAPADSQHLIIRAHHVTQPGRLCQRLKIERNMLPAGDAFGLAGELVPWGCFLDRGLAQRSAVHAERAKKPDVAPALQVFADPAALVDRHRQIERSR